MCPCSGSGRLNGGRPRTVRFKQVLNAGKGIRFLPFNDNGLVTPSGRQLDLGREPLTVRFQSGADIRTTAPSTSCAAAPGRKYRVSTFQKAAGLKGEDYLFPSRLHSSPHLSTRQYARIVEHWVSAAGLDTSAYGTHSMRRTRVTLICKRTKNLRAVQLLLGHSKLESTVHYLGIEVDDALEISEQTET